MNAPSAKADGFPGKLCGNPSGTVYARSPVADYQSWRAVGRQNALPYVVVGCSCAGEQPSAEAGAVAWQTLRDATASLRSRQRTAQPKTTDQDRYQPAQIDVQKVHSPAPQLENRRTTFPQIGSALPRKPSTRLRLKTGKPCLTAPFLKSPEECSKSLIETTEKLLFCREAETA